MAANEEGCYGDGELSTCLALTEGCIHHSLYLQLKANLPVVTAKLGGISIQHPS